MICRKYISLKPMNSDRFLSVFVMLPQVFLAPQRVNFMGACMEKLTLSGFGKSILSSLSCVFKKLD